MVGDTGKEFIEKTKFRHIDKPGQMKGHRSPPLELEFDSTKTLIDLPESEKISVNDFDLAQVIENRRSFRQYSKKALSLEELSYLLWCTQGVREYIPNAATFRNVPSAGARHALETYLLINNVEGLKPGLYRFLAIEHKLLELDTEPSLADKITDACLDQSFVKNSAVTFVWTAVAERMTWRYGGRGYRYLFLDAGHVCQNLYLSADSIGCGVCAIGAFLDDVLNTLLRIDGENQFSIYLAAVGKK
ncbi:MAG: SagB/ThcOx family dehydrogenase [Methanohalobium sp.]|uniref:SagB/ThcOx family dehydrogenase n=1 Tax=Methanohalobium sp. TaxID=2837493 RepID=UPI00397E5141